MTETNEKEPPKPATAQPRQNKKVPAIAERRAPREFRVEPENKSVIGKAK